MGRQTKIAATQTDEQALLGYMRSLAEIRILVRAASTADDLWVPEFAPFDERHRQYYLWNTAFPWTPKVQPGQDCVFIANLSKGPLIEFNRTDSARLLQAAGLSSIYCGRLYWARLHMVRSAAELSYDLRAFDKWYGQVIRWVRKHARRDPAVRLSPYLLPDAWERWQARGRNLPATN